MYTLPYLSEQTIQMLRLWKIIGMHVPLRGRWLPFVSVDQEIWFSDSEGKKQPKQQWQPEKLVNMILRGIKQAKQQILHSFFLWTKNYSKIFSLIFHTFLKVIWKEQFIFCCILWHLLDIIIENAHMCSFCSSFLSYVKGRDLCRLFGSLKKPILPPNTSQLQFSINK